MTTHPHRSLGAALIVRDEAHALAGCLISLIGIVDKVHVHDTGSIDGTPELAAKLGAIVTHGPWTDNFAEARNAALVGWTSDWVLSIDADERLVTNAPLLRGLLDITDVDLLHVEIDNIEETGGFTHNAPRLFRPATTTWEGQVHEQIVPRNAPLIVAEAPRKLLWLYHSGYHTEAGRRGKGVRNVALAQAALDELVAAGSFPDHDKLATAMADLGRSLMAVERNQDAIDTFEALREMFPGTRQWSIATDLLTRLVSVAGFHDVALLLTEELRNAGAQPAYCDWLAAQALCQLGLVEQAWLLLSGIDAILVDPSGCRHSSGLMRALTEQVEHLRRGVAVAGGSWQPSRN